MSTLEILLKVVAFPLLGGFVIAFIACPFLASAREKRIEDIVRLSEKESGENDFKEMYNEEYPIINPN